MHQSHGNLSIANAWAQGNRRAVWTLTSTIPVGKPAPEGLSAIEPIREVMMMTLLPSAN